MYFSQHQRPIDITISYPTNNKSEEQLYKILQPIVQGFYLHSLKAAGLCINLDKKKAANMMKVKNRYKRLPTKLRQLEAFTFFSESIGLYPFFFFHSRQNPQEQKEICNQTKELIKNIFSIFLFPATQKAFQGCFYYAWMKIFSYVQLWSLVYVYQFKHYLFLLYSNKLSCSNPYLQQRRPQVT